MSTISRYRQIRSYLNRNYYSGFIRWLLQDKSGHSVGCDRCGNIANGVMVINSKFGLFNVPLCKKHYLEIFPDTQSLPDVREYLRPKKIQLAKRYCNLCKIQQMQYP